MIRERRSLSFWYASALTGLTLLTVGCPKPPPASQPVPTPNSHPVSKVNPLPEEQPPTPGWFDQAPKSAPPAVTAAILDKGRASYLERCAVCHGDSGGGDGPYANKTMLAPRDFRQGIFKLRSTPTGSMPTEVDLFRTVTRGVPGGGMPGTTDLSEDDRWALVRYIQELTLADESDEKRDPIDIPNPTAQDAAAVARGRGFYLLLKCWLCHGVKGDATGLRSKELIDDWGKPIPVPNLTKPWPYKGGSTERDLYRSLVTGLDGSPMPTYGGDDTRWLFAKNDFAANWQEQFSKDLPKDAIADLKVLIDQLPPTLPRNEADRKKLSDGYLYDIVAYIRATFPRKVKE